MSERVGDELVIYDQVSHVAHCLAPEAVAVWECCDGDRTMGEIAHQLTVSHEVVEHAVAALAEQGLLEQVYLHGFRLLEARLNSVPSGGSVWTFALMPE